MRATNVPWGGSQRPEVKFGVWGEAYFPAYDAHLYKPVEIPLEELSPAERRAAMLSGSVQSSWGREVLVVKFKKPIYDPEKIQ